jgi:anaerobic selenocysteine-containing dehydrogenase
VRPGGDAFLAAFLCRRLVLEERASPTWRTHAWNAAAFAAFLANLDEERLLENAGMSREKATELLAWLCRFSPVTHYGGYGIQRYLSGHLQFWWIGALAVLLGAFERPGGGLVFGKDESVLFPEELLPLFSKERRLPIAVWFKELAHCRPPVELLVVTCANPLRQSPQSDSLARAFRNIPFKVCVDHVLTETAAACDLVLPATTFLEEGDDWRGSYWHNYLVRSEQVLQPRGQALSDVNIFSGFAEALGLSVNLEERKRLMDARLLADARLECVGEGLYKWDEPEFWRSEDACASLPLELPQGGCESAALSREGVTSSAMPDVVSETEDRRHVPFRLVTVHVAAYTNGQSHHVQGLPDLPECHMAPDEARERGFADGERLLLQGEDGEGNLLVRLVIDSSLGRGYVILPQGLPEVNSLTKALVSPGYGAPYAESYVVVTRPKGVSARA